MLSMGLSISLTLSTLGNLDMILMPFKHTWEHVILKPKRDLFGLFSYNVSRETWRELHVVVCLLKWFISFKPSGMKVIHRNPFQGYPAPNFLGCLAVADPHRDKVELRPTLVFLLCTEDYQNLSKCSC